MKIGFDKQNKIERYYKYHNEWIELENPKRIYFTLKFDFTSKGYDYYKPINGKKYRSKIK